MIVKHVGEKSYQEHRVVIDMTILEARLWLAAQPTVRNEAQRQIKAALAGCDQNRPLSEDGARKLHAAIKRAMPLGAL